MVAIVNVRSFVVNAGEAGSNIGDKGVVREEMVQRLTAKPMHRIEILRCTWCFRSGGIIIDGLYADIFCEVVATPESYHRRGSKVVGAIENIGTDHGGY